MKNEKKSKLMSLLDKLKKFFKNPKEVISFFLPIVITLCLLIPVPYYIKLGGGSIPLDDEISIKGEQDKKGSFDALYVKESRGVVFTYLLSYIIPSFDKEPISDVVLDDEDESSYNYREKLYFTTSLDAATKVAFEKASKKVEVSSSKFLVIYIDKKAKTNLEVGDEILKVNNEKVNNYKQINDFISKSDSDISILVKRDGKEVWTTSSLITIDGSKKLGIVISNEVKYTSDPKVDFKFNGKQAGPSGGLMITLSIYNKLMDYDITNGKKVFGTGTIDLEGNVGEIGGIKHKLIAASRKKADIVFVPSANYEEALGLVKKNNYKFKLVSVSTFDDAISYLDNNK